MSNKEKPKECQAEPGFWSECQMRTLEAYDALHGPTKDALDAARYRWLRSGVNHNASWLVGTYAQEDLDEQIDAVMKESA